MYLPPKEIPMYFNFSFKAHRFPKVSKNFAILKIPNACRISIFAMKTIVELDQLKFRI